MVSLLLDEAVVGRCASVEVEWVCTLDGRVLLRERLPPPQPPGGKRREIVAPLYEDDVAFRLSCL